MVGEHYCTLFDFNFLPYGLCLHESLAAHGKPFHLWILCMDTKVEAALRELALENVTLIPLAELEDTRLLGVKPTRSRGEYCWTLTPFLPSFVFARDAAVTRVTYLDADLYFFRSPAPILAELEASGADVLVTEHAYAPEYDQTATAGRFCVQFVTFRSTARSREILAWWQDRCIEWCFARHEDGKFGDQKYLDAWPALFGDSVRILHEKRLALAPWNAAWFLGGEGAAFRPVFYHFHGLRLIDSGKVRLFTGYVVGARARGLYAEYVKALSRARGKLRRIGRDTPFFPENLGTLELLRAMLRLFRRRTATAAVPEVSS